MESTRKSWLVKAGPTRSGQHQQQLLARSRTRTPRGVVFQTRRCIAPYRTGPRGSPFFSRQHIQSVPRKTRCRHRSHKRCSDQGMASPREFTWKIGRPFASVHPPSSLHHTRQICIDSLPSLLDQVQHGNIHKNLHVEMPRSKPHVPQVVISAPFSYTDPQSNVRRICFCTALRTHWIWRDPDLEFDREQVSFYWLIARDCKFLTSDQDSLAFVLWNGNPFHLSLVSICTIHVYIDTRTFEASKLAKQDRSMRWGAGCHDLKLVRLYISN